MQMNLQQAVEILDAGELPYSPANAAKVRGSARKCAKLAGYNCDLSRIPVDPNAFVARWRFICRCSTEVHPVALLNPYGSDLNALPPARKGHGSVVIVQTR